jgi:hypothetical protein
MEWQVDEALVACVRRNGTCQKAGRGGVSIYIGIKKIQGNGLRKNPRMRRHKNVNRAMGTWRLEASILISGARFQAVK